MTFRNFNTMGRKSFLIDDKDLDAARQAAKAEGVSLNRYILQAVLAKNTKQESSQHIEQASVKLATLLDQIRLEGMSARRALIEDAQRQSQLLKAELEQGAKKYTETSMSLVLALGKQIEVSLNPPRKSGGTHPDVYERPLPPVEPR
jgi:hypothetical protein